MEMHKKPKKIFPISIGTEVKELLAHAPIGIVPVYHTLVILRTIIIREFCLLHG